MVIEFFSRITVIEVTFTLKWPWNKIPVLQGSRSIIEVAVIKGLLYYEFWIFPLFPTLDFLIPKKKKREIQIFFCRYLYLVFLYTLHLISCQCKWDPSFLGPDAWKNIGKRGHFYCKGSKLHVLICREKKMGRGSVYHSYYKMGWNLAKEDLLHTWAMGPQ